MLRNFISLFAGVVLISIGLYAQDNKFNQMYDLLSTPNAYRTASGAPGHAYWQQKADYQIKIRLDDDLQRISGEETITYFNNSPDPLPYLWLQLDQNMRAKDSDTYATESYSMPDRVSSRTMNRLERTFDGGFKIEAVHHGDGKEMSYTINKTMMRVDLPAPLASGTSTSFSIKWWYNINNRKTEGGRSGFEYFEKDENYLYTIAQFFPRMAVYADNEGWQHKQFLGRGEFTLTFGDYDVEITVPEDHVVAATGTLQNASEVMTKKQLERYRKAQKSFEEPVLIITQEEAEENEQQKSSRETTWKFSAKNVRDFAFASSRKFIWDAMAVKQESGNVMAMSLYPKEGNPLWEKYSTKSVAHALKWFSHYTFDYPYPVAWSIHTDRIGMEYPMICFNGGRPESDGTYTARTKYGLISVVIHEVGHNYFPMIVNSDERQWTWMDEGLTSFVQFLAEQQWERDYPSRRGPAHKIVNYMKSEKENLSPIMTNSESIMQFGNNAYGKPATALNILRETIMGRELFDHAFKEYANRWMFKHPTPADFFRTMEDASAVDLDWFWRGWFYTTDNVDISLTDVRWNRLDNKGQDPVKGHDEQMLEENPHGISSVRNREEIEQTQDEIDPSLRDFYTTFDPNKPMSKEAYEEYLATLPKDEKKAVTEQKNYYELTFENNGGLLMPLIFEFEFEDGSKELYRIPAEIWRRNSEKVTKVMQTDKLVKSIVLDPYLETADVNRSNNYFPPQKELNRFELYKQRQSKVVNPMQQAAQKKKKGT